MIGKPDDETKYELKSIIIHRGGAYGGHYWAYIKDDLKEGNWHVELTKEFEDKPTEIKRKRFDATDFMTD